MSALDAVIEKVVDLEVQGSRYGGLGQAELEKRVKEIRGDLEALRQDECEEKA